MNPAQIEKARRAFLDLRAKGQITARKPLTKKERERVRSEMRKMKKI